MTAGKAVSRILRGLGIRRRRARPVRPGFTLADMGRLQRQWEAGMAEAYERSKGETSPLFAILEKKAAEPRGAHDR